MSQVVKSILLSVIASLLGTYLLRKALSASSAGGDGGSSPASGNNAVVVVVPVLVGNSANRFFSPTHEHRSLLGGHVKRIIRRA